MPEGPEIRIAADRIADVLLDQRVENVYFGLPRLRRFTAELTGAMVGAVRAHGKAMLVDFDNGLTLYSHNQLYGRWFVRARGKLPSTRRTLRVALHTAAGSALLYSASDIEVLDADGLAAHPFLSRLGPDILDPAVTWQVIEKRLRAPQFRNRSLASLYLDQSFIAGIGNYLRSEILHFARLHYARRPAALNRTERQRLSRQTRAVALRSYRTGGVTNPPARVRARQSAGAERRAAYRFAVFGRAGQPCDACGTPITRATAGSRRVYACLACQPQ